MDKIISWLFLLIAVMWLLPLIGVTAGGVAYPWIATIALIIIGLKGLMKK